MQFQGLWGTGTAVFWHWDALDSERVCLAVQFPRPSIWASPGTLVPQGSPVTIHCRGPSGVSVWRLLKAEPHPIWEDMSPHGVQGTLSFFIPSVSHFSAGTYSCQYLKRGFWSGHSGLLDLVVTGEGHPHGHGPQPRSLLATMWDWPYPHH